MATDVTKRYREILMTYFKGEDPFKMDGLLRSELPTSVTYEDILDYFLMTKSACTAKEFRAHKSLDSRNCFECGCVQKMSSKKLYNGWVVVGQVKHSPYSNQPLFKCWVHGVDDGAILCGYCSCMAGLSQCCSHVGAILFALEQWQQKSPTLLATSCADVIAKWLEEVPMAKIEDIFLTKNVPPKCLAKPMLPPFSPDELTKFFHALDKGGEDCVLMATHNDFWDNYVEQEED